METNDVRIIENVYLTRVSKVPERFQRYLYNQINWDARLIGIRGARGVGKTTLLLQRIRQAFKGRNDVFYASLDHLWFESHSLMELVDWLYVHGIRHLFLDEVHKLPNWAQIIKNLYDTYEDLNIVYTGSSMLEIDHSRVDLSRRQTLYTLHNMSFREYLALKRVANLPPVPLQNLLASHTDIAMQMQTEGVTQKHFEDYLREGCYPFSVEAGKDFLLRLGETADLVIESDLPAVENVSYGTMKKAKQLLMLISHNVPLTPNMSKLCAQLETTRDMCLKLLYALDRAGLLHLLTREAKDYKHLVSPEKIYLGNTNLMYALAPQVNTGTLRETFFANQLSTVTHLEISRYGDFQTGGEYVFEVGGRGKDYSQIADMEKGYLAVDNIEIGMGHRIPLYLFGMLY